MRRAVLTTVALALVVSLPVRSPGIYPVLDTSNLTQNVVTALHQVSAYAQQVQQYQLQLQQYANQIKNTLAPIAQVWQAAQGTMSTVLGTVSMFQNGSQLQGYLNQFQDVNYWLSAPAVDIRIRRPALSLRSKRMTHLSKASLNSKHKSARMRPL